MLKIINNVKTISMEEGNISRKKYFINIRGLIGELCVAIILDILLIFYRK